MEFHESTYFTSRQHSKLPSPTEVRALGGVKRGRAFVTAIESLNVFVKWGPEVQLMEALTMRAIRETIGSKVPIPEIFGWRRDQNDIFIYMQLIRGSNLEERWNTLDENAKVSITGHLREIMAALRSVKQGSQGPLIGTNRLKITGNQPNVYLYRIARRRVHTHLRI